MQSPVDQLFDTPHTTGWGSLRAGIALERLPRQDYPIVELK